MAKEETETSQEPRTHACNVCEDSGKVHLGINGKNGIHLREIPCPECDAGFRVSVNQDKVLRQMDERMQRIAWMVVIAIVLAGAAIAIRSKDPHEHGMDPFARAVKEGAEQ